MQYKKLTPEQKCVRSWRTRRNHLVSTILSRDPYISREEALREANRQMRGK